jgi:hypothetical protein
VFDNRALKKHLPGVAGAAVLVLALFETAQALLGPSRSPSENDWNRAADVVRSQWKAGDLVVAAPAWADPVMRLHLGDLVTVDMATRLDDAAYGRVWEISQKGGVAPEARGQETLHQVIGNLSVRRVERPAAQVKFDFVRQWQTAKVSRQSAAGVVPCSLLPDRHQCPDIDFNWVKPAVLEFDFNLRLALYAQPVAGANVVIEYDDVPMGRTLTIGAGLHHVWLRKAGDGTVVIEAFVGGQSIGRLEVNNRSPWKPVNFDTTAFAGQRQVVRFSIHSSNPVSRHFGFAAEARQ